MRMRHFWAIFGPKVAHPHNFGLALRICFQFCRMKGANSYVEIILMNFLIKFLFGANGLFRTQNDVSHSSRSAVRIVLQFRTMEEAKGDMEIILMFFSKKNLIQGNLLVFAPNWYVLITLGLLSGFLINFAT